MLRHELIHFILSILAGGFVYRYFKNLLVFVFALFFGFLLDADHLVDYFLYKRSPELNLKEFFAGIQFEGNEKLFVLFHGYEYAIILIIFALWLMVHKKCLEKARLFLVPILLVSGISLSLHLFFDTVEYKLKWQTYFLTYRMYHNFTIVN